MNPKTLIAAANQKLGTQNPPLLTKVSTMSAHVPPRSRLTNARFISMLRGSIKRTKTLRTSNTFDLSAFALCYRQAAEDLNWEFAKPRDLVDVMTRVGAITMGLDTVTMLDEKALELYYKKQGIR